MTKREVLKKEILKILEVHLNKFGFKLNKSLSAFTKKNSLGWQKYQIIFLLTDLGWQVIPTMLIRFNSVEDLYHKISVFEKKYRNGTPTIGVSIEDYTKDEIEARFHVIEEDQINEVSGKLFILFLDVALPFFEMFSSLESINHVMNSNPNDTFFTGPIFKGTKSIIVAKLLNDYRFDKIKNEYFEYYRIFSNGYYLSEYISLLKLLEGH